MRQHYYIDLVEEYFNVNFYSIHLEGEELSELERFFEKFPIGSEYDEDIDVVISWLDNIAERGALERYFRPEGHYGDGVGVIPIDIGNKVRLYCLRLSDKILVFGNGGVKDAPSWMKRSKVIEARRRHVNPEVKERVALSFQIVDRIQEILVVRNLRQKDLALMLGKSEAEISKWMRGTHNFTIDTVVAIEEALQAPILQVCHEVATA